MTTDPSAVPGTGTGTDRMPPRPAPVPDAGTERGTAVLAPAGTAVPMPAAVRAGTALRYHVRELWLNPGRLLHSLYHGEPGSMARHMAHVKSMPWVPPEMTGKPRTFLAVAGVAYQMTIGALLKNGGNLLSAAAPHPLAVLAIVIFVVILIVLL